MWGALLVLVSFWLPAEVARPDAGRDDDIAVSVGRNNSTVTIDVDFVVAASQDEAWAVLTDFEHMADFVSNLTSSRVVDRAVDRLRVSQRGRAARGMLSFDFESLREVELSPPGVIRTRMISGSFEKLDGVTRLVPEGPATRIIYHADAIPKAWIPPVIGPRFIEHETREQFGEVRAEILRRRDAARRR